MTERQRTLNPSNIESAIENYLALVDALPLTFSAENILSLLTRPKRTPTGAGPYPKVSLFESANRIMTDLVILYGVRSLLTEHKAVLDFDEYQVEYGNRSNDHDILASKKGRRLYGEAFNVSPTFFQTKKAKSIKKLRDGATADDFLLIMYNSDAVGTSYEPTIHGNEIHLPVAIKNWK